MGQGQGQGQAVRVRALISEECDAICDMLLSKNASYGNSALEPLRVFSRASAKEQLLVRIDDKLSRLSRGHEHDGEDTVRDLVGYLVLLLVSRRLEQLVDAEELSGIP